MITKWMMGKFDSLGDDVEARLAFSRKVFYWTHIPLIPLFVLQTIFLNSWAGIFGITTTFLSAFYLRRTYIKLARAAREAYVRRVMES